MPKYLLSVWHDEEYVVDFTSDDMMRIGPQVGAFNEELTAAGALVFADGLQPASTSTVYSHAVDHSISTASGPYAGTPRQMGGFWVIEVADDAAAAEWARKASRACEGVVELRPFQVH